MRAKVSISRPDPVSSSTASAVSTMTSMPSVSDMRPPPRSSSFSAEISSGREALSAGASANRTVVAIEIVTAKSNTR